MTIQYYQYWGVLSDLVNVLRDVFVIMIAMYTLVCCIQCIILQAAICTRMNVYCIDWLAYEFCKLFHCNFVLTMHWEKQNTRDCCVFLKHACHSELAGFHNLNQQCCVAMDRCLVQKYNNTQTALGYYCMPLSCTLMSELL